MTDPATDASNLLATAFELTKKQKSLFIRIGWVTFVSVHIMWVCGWLAWAGLASPFAKAADFKDVAQNVSTSTRINLVRELRDQYAIRCAQKDQATKTALDRYIEILQDEYQRLTGQRYPEPPCQ